MENIEKKTMKIVMRGSMIFMLYHMKTRIFMNMILI
nr:MAG TPA: hypothetical protein [Inoviridae sp.]